MMMRLRLGRGLMVALMLMLVLAIGAGCSSTPTTATPKEPEPPKIEATVKATDLYKEYKANAVAADQKYKGKLIEVKGEVDSIGKDILDKMYVTLVGDGYFSTVQVYFPNSAADAVAKLKKGDSLKVQGTCDGMAIVNVVIKNAVIVPATK